MKRIIAAICAVFIGWAVQQVLQSDVQQLELQASAAWNSGDVEQAESLARRALFQSPESIRACDVLIQVARHEGRPDLQAAATKARFAAQHRDFEGLLAAGDIARSNDLLRLAESYWTEAIKQQPADVRVHQRLTIIAGTRLDLLKMQDRLLAWAEIAPPEKDVTLLYLGLSSIDERDASSAFDSLYGAVKADQRDLESRMGLGRCLLAMHRYDACVRILEACPADSDADSVRAVALSVAGRTQEAADLLQKDDSPDLHSSSRHFATGLVARANGDWQKAEQQLALAVKDRPLSRPFRSRYCEILRRNGADGEYHKHVARMGKLREIVELAAAGVEKADAKAFRKLKELCEAVGATSAAAILSCYDL